MSAKKTNAGSKLKAISLGILSGILLCEIVLRIYNPVPSAVKKGKLIVPANQQKIFTNNWIKKLDKKIYYSRNSLGFRGPELPADPAGLLSVITVGGSTTECKFLSDSCTWPALLYAKLHRENNSVWLNNAGIDGHTTFGHLLLVKEYISTIKPAYMILMTGVNDMELGEPDEFDKQSEKKINTGSAKLFFKSLVNHTELGQAFLTYYQLKVSYKKGLVHKEIDLTALIDNPLRDTVIAARLHKQAPYLAAYKQRIDSIISICLRAGIQPVLVTQPSLYGAFTDPVTNIAMGNKWSVKDPAGENSFLMEKILELYNDVLLSFQDKVTVIDLARQMPKNSGYFYDFAHVTNAGAEEIATILFRELRQFIYEKKMK